MRARRFTLVQGQGGRTAAGAVGAGRRSRSSPPAVVRQGSTPPTPPPEPSFMRDSYASTAFADVIDRSVHAATARFTAGLSPMALAGAYIDWAAHLASSPGKQLQLVEKAVKKSVRLATLRQPPRAGQRWRRALHRATAAGPALRRPSWRRLAVQSDLPGVPAAAAVVAQRDDRRARRDAAARERRSSSPRGSSSTCSRRRTSRSPIPRCWSARAPKAA